MLRERKKIRAIGAIREHNIRMVSLGSNKRKNDAIFFLFIAEVPRRWRVLYLFVLQTERNLH